MNIDTYSFNQHRRCSTPSNSPRGLSTASSGLKNPPSSLLLSSSPDSVCNVIDNIKSLSKPPPFHNGNKSKNRINPYTILELRRDATPSDVIRSYRRLALLNHPHRRDTTSLERNHHQTICTNTTTLAEQLGEWKFLVIAASYETLKNKKYRRQYNVLADSQNLYTFNRQQLLNPRRKLSQARSLWVEPKRGLERNDSVEQEVGKTNSPDTASFCNMSSFGSSDGFHSHVDISPNKITSSSLINSVRYEGSCDRYSNDKLFPGCSTIYFSSNEGKRMTCEMTNSTYSDEEEEEIREETDEIFGGLLSQLYKARNYEPFTDAFTLFEFEFGSDIFRSCLDDSDEEEDDFNEDFNNNTLSLDSRLPQILSEQKIRANVSNPSVRNQYYNYQEKNNMTVGLAKQNLRKSSSKENRNDDTKKHVPKGYPSLPAIPPDVLERECLIGNKTSERVRLKPPSPLKASSIITTTEKDGDDVIRKTIVIKNNTRIVKSERTTTDPVTGERQTIVQVERDEIKQVHKEFDQLTGTTPSSTPPFDKIWQGGKLDPNILPQPIPGTKMRNISRKESREEKNCRRVCVRVDFSPKITNKIFYY